MKRTHGKGVKAAERIANSERQMNMVIGLLYSGECTTNIIKFMAENNEYITVNMIYEWRRKLKIKAPPDYRKLNTAKRDESGRIKPRGPALMEPEEMESIILHRRLSQLMPVRHNQEVRAS